MTTSFWKEAVPRATEFLHQQTDSPQVRLLTGAGDVHQIGLHTMATHLAVAQIAATLHLSQSPEEILALISPEIKAVMVSGLLETGFMALIPVFEHLNQAGITIPFILGGGMVSERFVSQHLAPVYKGPICFSKRPETSIPLIRAILDGDSFEFVVGRETVPVESNFPVPISGKWQPAPVPTISNFDRQIVLSETIDSLWPWISPRALFQLHLGFQGNFEKALSDGVCDAVDLLEKVNLVKSLICDAPEICQPKAVYQFFRVKSVENEIHFFDQQGSLLTEIAFPRQAELPHRCLTDWISPQGDVMPVFITTVAGATQTAATWFSEGKIEEALILQHLACQLAEAFAEKLHHQLRKKMAIGEEAPLSILDIEQVKYQGRRYSFGYAACPNLADQHALFSLLNPFDIEVHLSPIFMMEPEASVSAMVFHHPSAIYFGVGGKS